MVCMYVIVNKKGLYCVVNVVIVTIQELNWGSWHCGTEVGVDLCVHCSCGCREPCCKKKVARLTHVGRKYT